MYKVVYMMCGKVVEACQKLDTEAAARKVVSIYRQEGIVCWYEKVLQ